MVGTILAGRYYLEEEIRRPALGAIYRATDGELRRRVAIHVIEHAAAAEERRRICAETLILSRLSHVNIIRLYDIGETNDILYIIYENMSMNSLARRSRRSALYERMRLTLQVAAGLGHAHAQGVVHGNVKPSNILLATRDCAKLAGFGLAVLRGPDESAGLAVGTPSYMSPEQVKGRRLDHRVDHYALGVILYEMIAGAVPFRGTPEEVRAMHVQAAPPPLRSHVTGLSPEAETLVLSLLEKDPANRPSSCAEIESNLRWLIENDPLVRDPGESPTVTCEVQLWRGGCGTDSRAQEDGEDAEDDLPLTVDHHPAEEIGSEGDAPRSAAFDGFETEEGLTEEGDGFSSSDALVEKLAAAVEREPIPLGAGDRFLLGHYLAYLMSSAKRPSRIAEDPIDERNADRARYILAMTSILARGGGDPAIKDAARLLDARIEVRSRMTPLLVAKYIDFRSRRDTCKVFRRARRSLAEASEYAREKLLDANGALNPGLIPRTMRDLTRIAPPYLEIDRELVENWREAGELWKNDPGLRGAVLRYTAHWAAQDYRVRALWPEVIYPLVQRARYRRANRSLAEVLGEGLVDLLLGRRGPGAEMEGATIGDARSFFEAPRRSGDVSEAISADAIEGFAEMLGEGDDGAPSESTSALNEQARTIEAHEERMAGLLAWPEPILKASLSDLSRLWRDSYASRFKRASSTQNAEGSGYLPFPVGAYRLAVIATIRGMTAGEVAIQGMKNKQIELMVPSLRLHRHSKEIVLAIWLYRDQSLVIAYQDQTRSHRFIFWEARESRQFNCDDRGSLERLLIAYKREAPLRLDDSLADPAQTRRRA